MSQTTSPDRHDRRTPAFGALLRAKRQSAGLSLTALAHRSGVTHQQIARLERGDSQHPTPRVVARLARALGMSTIDLYVLAGHISPDDLPSFRTYLLAKYPDCPEAALQALDEFYNFIKDKYGLEPPANDKRRAAHRPI
jgi:transcriptional regulator with XRE-family HTH domain